MYVKCLVACVNLAFCYPSKEDCCGMFKANLWFLG